MIRVISHKPRFQQRVTFTAGTQSHHPFTVGQWQQQKQSLDTNQSHDTAAIQSLQSQQVSNAQSIANHTLSIQTNSQGIFDLQKWVGSTVADDLSSKQQTPEGEKSHYQPTRINNQTLTGTAQQFKTFSSNTSALTDDDYHFFGTPKLVNLNNRFYLGVPGFFNLKGTSDVGAPDSQLFTWDHYQLRQGMCIGSVSKQDRSQSNKNVSAIITNAITGITTVFGHNKSSGPIIQGCMVQSTGESAWAFNIQRGGVYHQSSIMFKKGPRVKEWKNKQRISTNEGNFWENSCGSRWKASDILDSTPTYYLDKICEAAPKTYVVDSGGSPIVQQGFIAQELATLFPRQSTHRRDIQEEQQQKVPPGINYAGLVVPLVMAFKQQREIMIKLAQRIKRLQKLTNQQLYGKRPGTPR